jgi:GNAT superfamily N-acetyltransferase
MGSVEIRDYRGDGTEVAGLLERSWTRAYGGKSWFPLWDARYFRWRLIDACGDDRSLLMAAYVDDRLVGCVLAEVLEMRLRGDVIRGALSSWLGVEPGVQGRGVAMALAEALKSRTRAQGSRLTVGITSADPASSMRRFWNALEERTPGDTRVFGKVNFWTRAFDGPAIAAASLTTFERVASRVTAPIPIGWLGWRTPAGVRRYEPGDLDRCLAWLEAQSADADLAVKWSRARLAMQLDHAYVTTLVIDDGETGGFINWYAIDYQGRQKVRIGIIDLFAGTLSTARRIDLLKAACVQMRSEGVHMSMMMASEASPSTPLLAAGFIPLPAHLDMFAIFPEAGLPLTPPMRVHTLFT